MESRVPSLLRLAQQQYAQSNFKLAVSTLHEALKLEPENYEVHRKLGDTYYEYYRQSLKKQMLKLAKTHINIALELNPESAHSYSTLALIYKVQYKVIKAEKAISKALELAPQNASYHRIAGFIHNRRWRWSKNSQIKYYKKALELNPFDVDTMISLSSYYFNSKGDTKKAQEYATSALRIAPDDPEALIMMGYILYKNGKVAEAKEHAMLAVAKTPDSYPALKLLCLASTNRYSLTGMSYRSRIWLSTPMGWAVILILIISRLGVFYYFYISLSGRALEKKVKRKYMKEINLKKGF